MTQVRRTNNIGRRPTASQQLIHTSDKLGLPGIKEMQGTTFNLFDTIMLPTGAGRQTLNFFSSTANKSNNFTNFQAGMLKAGESMVIEELNFIVLVLSGTDLTSDATAITGMYTLLGTPETIIPNAEGMILGQLRLSIMNQTVSKAVNTFELHPSFNRRTSGIATIDTATATNRLVGQSKLMLESAPILPANQSLQVSWDIAPTGTVAANTAIMCVAGRFGSIYSSKTTL
jgi:hypothetical protein